MIEIITFGTKHARAERPAANEYVDARFLPNPPRHLWAEAEKWLVDQLLLDSEDQYTRAFRNAVRAVVSNCQRMSAAGRNYTYAFYCLGGKHRSVFMADRVAYRLRSIHDIEVNVHHLDIDR